MKQIERASIMRIISDMIKADTIIDTREIQILDALKEKYSITKADDIVADSLPLSQAVENLQNNTEDLLPELVDDLAKVTLSDDYCAREEALLLLSIKLCLAKDASVDTKVLSIDTLDFNIEPTQILYVEGDFDNDINWEINEKFREISSEIRLAGFDFVYLPKIAEHYRSIAPETLERIAEFLYPKATHERLQIVSRQLRMLSTSDFCKNQLSGKLGVKLFQDIQPSLLMRIGESIIDSKRIENFLVIELTDDVLNTVRNIIDQFAELYHTFRLNYSKEEKGRFIFSGFYKQIFDILMIRKGIKSRIVIDVVRNRIILPEADAVLDRLHRREKALYTLFLLESASGGINFNKPDNPKQMIKHEKRLASVQTKYAVIYKKFGGDPENAPNLCISEIRLPMISLIKKQIQALGDVLNNADDYMVQRNFYGNYCVNIPPSLCCCCGFKSSDVILLSDSIEWQKISAL